MKGVIKVVQFIYGFLTSSVLFLLIISIILMELSDDRDFRNLITQKKRNREKLEKLKVEEKSNEVQTG